MKIKTLLSVFVMFVFINSANAQSTIVVKDTTLKTTSGKNLNLETLSGDVIISRGNIDEVNVKVFGSEELKNNIEYIFTSDNDGVIIKSKSEKKNNGSGMKFELTVPSDYNLKVSSSGGDLKITGISGSHKLTTSGGDISITDCRGDLKSVTSGGDINIKIHDGNIKAVTSGGNIVITTSNGEIEAVTSGGDIQTEYSGINKGIKLTSMGGDIKLIIPNDFQADLSLSTTGGEVKVDLDNVTEKKVYESYFKGQINGGGESIKCTTTGGNILIGKK
jgi:hypothetical protein